jgi:hypothetical protein
MSSIKSPGEGKPWGKITWYFIHTFCERINETFFIKNRETVLSLLSSVCSMIPCPICRTHAEKHLKHNPLIKMVRNKDELKTYFFRFHNQAKLNGNKSAKVPDQSIIDMYKRANFKKIVDAFRYEYTKKTPTRLDYAHTLYSQTILKSVLNFVYSNQQWFVQQPQQNITVSSDTETENITFSVTE